VTATARPVATIWAARIAVLLLVPAAIALADSFIRPIPPDLLARSATTRPAGSAPASSRSVDTSAAVEALVAAYNDGSALFVDARPAAEFRAAHLAGAFHLPFEAFLAGRPAVLDFLPTDFPLIVYCGGGDCDASHQVERMLRTFGYQQVEIFEPGWPAILAAGLPTMAGE
jgi:rhodanese-related sulfurtransferase